MLAGQLSSINTNDFERQCSRLYLSSGAARTGSGGARHCGVAPPRYENEDTRSKIEESLRSTLIAIFISSIFDPSLSVSVAASAPARALAQVAAVLTLVPTVFSGVRACGDHFRLAG